MKSLIQKELIVVAVIILLIIILPSGSKTEEFNSNSLLNEHGASTLPMVESNSNNPSANEPVSESLVSISRPKGGYTAFIGGTFIEPAATPTPNPEGEDAENSNNDNTDNSNSDNTNKPDGNNENKPDGNTV